MQKTMEGAAQKRAKESAKLEYHPKNFIQELPKRTFDIFFSFLSLFFLAPFFVMIGLVIKHNSPGPVYFKGERMGRFGKPFKIIKFRTMFETPASYAGASITGHNDNRITPFGRWLRDTKLNELPQLWNVLKGEMSFVGPRPEIVEIVNQWPDEVREQILSIRPGITSPASILYRDEEKLLQGDGFLDDYLRKILPDKLRLDQLYVRESSLLTDLDVLSMTIVMLIPAIRGKKLDEKRILSGTFYTLYRWFFGWLWLDMVVVILAVGLSGLIWRFSAVINLGVPVFIIVAITIAIILSLINLALGLNRIDWDKASPVFVIDLAISTALTMVIIWLVNRYWLVTPWLPFSMLWMMGLTIFVGVVTIRYRERLITGLANRWLLIRGPKSSFAERILIVGAGNLGQMTLWLLSRSVYSSIFGVVGFVDDDIRKQGSQIMGVSVIGTTQNLTQMVEKYKIGLIFFSIGNTSETRRQEMIAQCKNAGAKTVVIPDLVKVLEHSINSIEVVESR